VDRGAPDLTVSSLSRRQLAGLGALALLPRLVNLGSFSLWLDEVIETEQAGGSLGHLLAELRHDAVHPPLEGLLTWTLLHLGLGETARRLVAVALGVATVLLLAAWAGRRFGERAGLAVGVVAALSPIGVHYAQELRPYALALFLMVAALVLLDRLLGPPGNSPGTSSGGGGKSPGGKSPGTLPGGELPGTWWGRREALRGGLLFLAVAGCLYTLYLSALVMVPLGWGVLEAAFGPPPADPAAAARRRRGRRLLALSPLFLLALGLAYLPWLPTVLALRSQRIQRAPGPWTLRSAFDRFEDLTVGGGGPVPAWAGTLALALAAIGLAVALRRASGRVAIAGFLAGTVGVEVLLAAGHHWSSLRYDLVGWPFLMVVLGVGAAALGGRLGTGVGTGRLRWAALAGLAVLAVAQLAGIVQYYLGREDWQRVAEAVAAVRRPAEPAFALNQSTRIGLLYYLDVLAGRSPAAEDPTWFASVDGSAERLAALWPADRCALLVTQSWGRQGKIVRLAREFPELAAYPATFVRLFLLTPQKRDELLRAGRPVLGPAAPGAPACDRDLPPALALPRAERRFGRLRPALAALGYETGLRPGSLPH
jgi:hypothetical protein